MLRAEILEKKWDFIWAIEHYKKVLWIAKFYMEPIKKIILIYKNNNDWDNVLKWLDKLDRISPLNVDRKIDIWEANLYIWEEDKAEERFQKAISMTQKKSKDKISDLYKKIWNTVLTHSPQKSCKYFEWALETKWDDLTKKDLEIFNLLWIALRREWKYKEAIEKYKIALKISPNDENLFFNIAIAAFEDWEIDTSLEYLEKGLEKNPNIVNENSNLCFKLWEIFYNWWKFEDALEFFRIFLNQNQDNKIAIKYIKNIQEKISNK